MVGGKRPPRWSISVKIQKAPDAAEGCRVLRRCEFHLKVEKHREGLVYDNATFERLCREHLPAVLPEGVELTLVRWEQIAGGKKLHPRYILTEMGGIGFEVGLHEGKPEESTDVAILEPAILEQRRSEYQLDSPVFRRAQEPIQRGRIDGPAGPRSLAESLPPESFPRPARL